MGDKVRIALMMVCAWVSGSNFATAQTESAPEAAVPSEDAELSPASGTVNRSKVFTKTLEQIADENEGIAVAVATVGEGVKVTELVIPGSEVEPIEIDDASPIVIRISEVRAHGTDFRYDMEIYGREPGIYELGKFLRRRSSGVPIDGPPLYFQVKSVLPEDRFEPSRPQREELPAVGGYGQVVAAVVVLWGAGMLVLLIWNLRRDSKIETKARGEQRPLETQLAEAIDRALKKQGDRRALARVETLLITYWRRRLGLEQLTAEAATARLRQHPEAGALLTELELGLHAPIQSQGVDWGKLLAPYRSLLISEVSTTAQESKR